LEQESKHPEPESPPPGDSAETGTPAGRVSGPVAPPAAPAEDFSFTRGERAVFTAGDEAWNGAPAAAEVGEARSREERAEPRPQAGGPNLMLAIVCWVASATALFESYALLAGHSMPSYAFTGYGSLGLGLLLFGIEAASWGRPRQRWVEWLFAPAALLTLIGVVCLVLSQAPGRRI
jgi:hypothetical protein